jgi:hypothetical protein
MPDAKSPPDQTRDAGFIETVQAVLWSFFGVRRRAALEKDAKRLNPVHVVIVGVFAAFAFVMILIAIVRAVVG